MWDKADKEVASILQKNYSLGFTTGAALLRESVTTAQLYDDHKDWNVVREIAIKNNVFQARTQSTAKKIYREVSKRLGNLRGSEIELLAQDDENQVKTLVWLAVCRQYRLIKEFATEIIVPKFNAAQIQVGHEDYDAFFNQKAEWHENLDSSSDNTRYKARQVLFLILKDCGVVGANHEIQNQLLDDRVKQLIIASNPEDLGIYPGQ